MSVKFRDYYEILGVSRDASAEEIRSSYRKLARKYHPDVNKDDPKAEDRLKEVNEAYEVLKDPEKRRKYDALGADWKNGQEFRPPPGFGGFSGGGSAGGFNFGGGFSDFFEAIFGSRFQGAGGARGGARPFGSPMGGGGYTYEGNFAGDATEAEIQVPLDTVVEGGRVQISVSIPPHGPRTLEVRIPRGIAEGKRIRLSGQGEGGADLHLRIKYAPGEKYRMDGDHLIVEARVSPAVAVLGGKATVPTPDGEISLTIPPGSSSGRRLRVRGKGLPGAKGRRGDLLVQIMIQIPADPTPEERALYEQLAALK